MPIRFNSLLRAAGIDPADVRLLRHQDHRATRGRSPYRLWRESRIEFEDYQSRQPAAKRSHFVAKHWASFVGTPEGGTLFVGLYAVGDSHLSEADWIAPHSGQVVAPGIDDLYVLTLSPDLAEFVGLLYVDWGPGMRSRSQRADLQDKIVVELRRDFHEPPFPGYDAFIARLSEIEDLPLSWATALSASRGVYLLTCPRTREQYVGSASGAGGFLSRWLDYARNAHGGNVALKSREASDYRISILEVAGSSATPEVILTMEARWKDKLQSGEGGLNRN